VKTSLRDLAAGVICAGFEGRPSRTELRSVLHDFPLAGFVFFERNADSIDGARTLTDALRDLYAGLLPILAIDQEGGRVARINRGNVQIPSAMAMAAAGQVELTRRAGAQVAHDLRRGGFNLNFAPVLDLALEPANVVIGTRAFSADPQVVVEFAGAFAGALRSGGIVPTFKHFPGHGGTAVDSHAGLPVIEADEPRLRDRDLMPFAELLPHAPAVMTAHVVVNVFDRRPATLSPRVLGDLLRRDIGFSGVCFTDCMQMEAIAKTVGSEEGSVQALISGADCILLSNGLDVARRIAQRIERAVDSGRLPHQRLEEAYARVQALRGCLSEPLPLESPPPDPTVGKEIARRAFKWIRGECRLTPAQSCVVSFGPSLSRNVPALEERVLPLDPTTAQTDWLLDEIRVLGKRIVVLSSRAHLHESQARTIERLLTAHADACIVSTLEPFDQARFTRARHVAATFGDSAPSLEGLASKLFTERAVVA